MANEKLRYSDEELEEFRAIIEEKLKVARLNYKELMAQLNHSDSNDIVDTSPTYKALEEGSEAQSKEDHTDGTAPAEIHQGFGGSADPYRKQDLWYRP